MRILSILFLLAVFMTSMVSAEQLTSANTIGQGGWAVEGVGVQNQNVSNNTDYTQTTYGGYVGYGILDDLDAYLSYGISSVGGLPATGNFETTGSGIGLSLKYRFLKEGANMPVSAAAALQYKSTSVRSKNDAVPAWLLPASDTTTPGSQMSIGVGCSKVIIPFVPYAGIAYRTNASDGTEQSTQLDITLGTAIAWSKQGAVLLEYTAQSITLTGGTNYSSGQIAGGIAYKI